MVRRLAQTVGPEALRANMMLLSNNARLAAQIAVALVSCPTTSA